MEGLNGDRFSLARIRETDMVGYLSKLGHKPVRVRKNGTDHWYLSPLRTESKASFHVNQLTNEWYDFPDDTGGNLVDFCLRYHGCSIRELLARFNADLSMDTLPVFDALLHEGGVGTERKLVVTDVQPLYLYPLKNYLHERSIPVTVADAFCTDVHYEIGGRNYYGIGFKNDSGGFEIRNKQYKVSSSPKDITTMSFRSSSVEVFEGFFDFLSYQAMHPYRAPGSMDYVVLNGAGLFDRAIPFLEQHERVGLWLDRDVTGQAYTQYALSLGSKYRDESGLYSKHKDLNDWLIHKGETPKPRVRPSLRQFSGG